MKNPTSLPFSVWAIADLHLSFGVPDKSMQAFGTEWIDWTDKIKIHWLNLIGDDDLVLIPGDISWAMNVQDASPDLEWINQLPGTKVLARGNHDYWWGSKSKVESILPSSIHIVQNNAYFFNGVSIAGVRLWDTPEYSFDKFVIFKQNKKVNVLHKAMHDSDNDEKVFTRELSRLELSLKELDQSAAYRIAMTHYPPIGAELQESKTTKLLEKYKVDICVFGHLHSLIPESLPFGKRNGIHYHLTSCDYLNFKPIKLL